jgi:hypothetical protein
VAKDIHSSGRPHFRDAQWADFVRGIGGEILEQEIRNHLDSGCEPCRVMASLIASVAETGKADGSLQIPADVIASAKAIFQPVQTGWMESLRTVVAELVTQIPLDWQPVGVRSLANVENAAGDRFLYRAGNYAVDLKVESPSSTDPGEIIGQIANDEDTSDNLAGVLVQMVVPGKTTLGKTIGETSTNRFGEFLIAYPAHPKAMLRFALKRQGQRIDLPLRLRH